MNHRTEWEVLDRPGSGSGRRLRASDLLRAVLGAHWRWKLAGFAAAAGVLLTVGVLVAGVFLVGLIVLAVALGIALQVRHWAARARQAFNGGHSGGPITAADQRDDAHRFGGPPRDHR